MARQAITYRAARRNLVLRAARMLWHPAVCFTPGGREYGLRPALKGERVTHRNPSNGDPLVMYVKKAWAPKIHKGLPQALLIAARIAETREVAAAA